MKAKAHIIGSVAVDKLIVGARDLQLAVTLGTLKLSGADIHDLRAMAIRLLDELPA